MNLILCGDAVTVLRTLPDKSCRCCVTSPPYYKLRDYGFDGQIGLEPTPEEYISQLVEVFHELRRVLTDDGTLWLNIADTYAGGGRGGHGAKQHINKGTVGMPGSVKNIPPKNLIGIPWMLAFALRADGWILRQEIIWAKPNPMPESVTDRCTKSHESIFLFAKQPHYYFDAAAIKEPVAESTVKRLSQDIENQKGSSRAYDKANGPMRAVGCATYRNKRDVWTVSTIGYKDAHFATFPLELVRPCILAGSAEGDTVIDPFAGSGTTGMVAAQEGRKYICIDGNPEYVQMAERRIKQNSARQLQFSLPD